MAKKKETIDNEKFLENVTNGQIYEGLVCIDIKLQKLLDIFDNINGYVEAKKNGTLTI